jgi:peptidoglycan/xylan/chitin deacetylase (PgdA/CDA1 family)
VSLDLDDLWTYLRTRGDPAWVGRPSYLPVFLPLVLDLLARLDLRITFFLVGSDVTREINHPHLRAITAAGHEVGNHSFSHEPWLHLQSREELRAEVGRAEEAIAEVCGARPVGFRGPGFSWSRALLEVLVERGYAYDASTLPTFLAPLARLYFLAGSRLSREEQRRRAGLFGSARDGFRSIKPYRWRLPGGGRLLEIPITTVPVLRTPFHMSYLLFLARRSERLMVEYLRGAIGACRATGVQPSFLLHPLDFLDAGQAPGLAFFPGMDLPAARKAELVRRALGLLQGSFRLVPMAEHARQVMAIVPGPAEAVA